MGLYRFNVFTRKLDLVGSSAGVPHHSFSGNVDVDFPDGWYLQDTDGEFITDEHGDKIFTGCPGQPILDTDGEQILDSNGLGLYDTNYGLHGHGGYRSPYQLDTEGGILLDTDEEPLLETNWRQLIVDGIATPLDTLETQVVFVTIQAKFTNLGKIWIGDSLVRKYRGIYLTAGMMYSTSIDDLRKLYIIGNAGEGVTFEYGTNTDMFLTTPGGEFVTTPGGDQIG